MRPPYFERGMFIPHKCAAPTDVLAGIMPGEPLRKPLLTQEQRAILDFVGKKSYSPVDIEWEQGQFQGRLATSITQVRSEALLTPAETRVLWTMGFGLANNEIADVLCNSTNTIRVHKGSIFAKMDVSRNTQAVMMGVKKKWLLVNELVSRPKEEQGGREKQGAEQAVGQSGTGGIALNIDGMQLKEILGLVAQGLTNEEIAQKLTLSSNMVKRRLLFAYRKLGVTGRTQAVMLALRQGEIHLDDMIIVIRGVTTAEQKSQLSRMIARANENGRRFTVRALADVNSQKPTGTHVVFKEFA